MGKMINVNIRVDQEVKKEAEILFEEMGVNMSSAVNMFLRQVIRTRGIPFEVTAKQDDFFNPYNQKILRESIAQLEAGMGTVHEIIEVDE